MRHDNLLNSLAARFASTTLLLVLFCWLQIPSAVHAQVVATWIGPATGNWSNPANWDIGVVPINNGATTYNVIIPAGKTIEFDIGANSTISGLNLQDTGKINIASGKSLNVSGFTLVAGIITSNGVGSNFTASSPLTVFQPSPELHATNGATIQVNGPNYSNDRNYSRTFLSSIGTGSQLNMSAVTTFDFNGYSGYDNLHTVEAGQGGVINLSNTQTIDGAPGADTLRFWIHSGGSINLQNLTTITKTNAYAGARTLFDLEVPAYSLPNLQDADGVEFKIRAGNTVQLQSLTGMRDSRLDLIAGANFVAPLLTDIRGSYVRVGGGSLLSTPQFIQINNSELHIHTGGLLNVASTSYTNDRNYSRTFLSSIGTGSQLNMSAVTTFDFNGYSGYDNLHTVEAGQGGVINLSNTQTIDGAPGADTLRFWIHSGGSINLQNLTTITKTNAYAGARTFFDIDSGAYTLPNLLTANGASFDVVGFSILNLPQLTSLIDGVLDVPALATVNAPLLTDVRGSVVRVAGATIVNTPAFTAIGNAELHAFNGGLLNVASTSYTNDRNYSRTFLSSIGTGSQLNMSAVTTFDFNGYSGYANVHTVEAGQGGVVNLSNTQTIDGAAGSDLLRFFSSGAGRINIGAVGQTTNLIGGRTKFEVTGTNSVIHFGSNVNMAANTEMKATLNGRFEAEGDFVIKTNNVANFDLADGQLRMIGDSLIRSVPQGLEVAGTDNGLPTGSLGSNFQIGLLQIGTNSVRSRVILNDSYNNNTNAFDTEALYLQGFPSEVGLRLLNSSALILNGMNAYIANGAGGYFSARDLIDPNVGFVQFGGGFVSLTGAVGEIINGDFGDSADCTNGDINAHGKLGFNGKGAGTADGIATDMGQRLDQCVMRLTAGSSIEISQNVSTFNQAFTIEFDALAQDDSGTLSLYLGGDLLQSWDYSELLDTNSMRYSYMVSDPSLWGLIDSQLALRWDADTGDRILLDNWSMSLAVPEPGNLAVLLMCGGIAACGRRNRIRSRI